MSNPQKTTAGKALEINQDTKIYGTFAEIGAGQEVARFFFQAGKASQTIAKTISAYDMIYSDEIYGKETSGRYVCEPRLEKMLTKEFNLLIKRLNENRGEKTTFFAYANTVATGDLRSRTPHGWMGIRFQTKPNGPPNDIVLHLRLLDRYRLMQQEALGVMGVNLVHAAFRARNKIDEFIHALTENLKVGQFVIDMIRFTGPDVVQFDNHLVNLELVRRGLADAVLFSPDQNITSISDTFYDRPLVIERGSFRPITNSHLELMEHGCEAFATSFPKAKSPLKIFEVTMHELKGQASFDEQDFLDRVRALTSTGHWVLVSKFLMFYQLKQFLRTFTKEPVAMIIGANLIEKIFTEKYYSDLEGGLLEGLSKLLDASTRLLVFPMQGQEQDLTSKTYSPPQRIANVYQHFLDQKWIVDMAKSERDSEFVAADRVAAMIREGDKTWLKHVPPAVAEMIKKENLFGLMSQKKT